MRYALLGLTFLSLLFVSVPASAACGDTTEGAPCVTRVERGWSHSLEVRDRGVRVQVQTWGWVWVPEYGEWQWQAIARETVTREHDEREDYSEHETTGAWTSWDVWSW